MPNYKIEGDIDFYGSLYSSLDYDSDKDQEPEDKNNVCEITGQKLTNFFVTLECNHKFNYNAIYKEIYKQKFIFRSYNFETLLASELAKFKESKKDYFIKGLGPCLRRGDGRFLLREIC